MSDATPATSAITPPKTRDLRPPHFLLRTPDGLGSYFDRENNRIVMSPHEPLSAFLVPAKLVDDPAAGPGRTRQRIEYDFSGCDESTLAPLDHVPASLLASLEKAVTAFYARVDDPASKATDHEKRIRRGFRLPDPDLEKDTYWLCGPRDDRRLLILWGCEVSRGSSLTLCARSDSGKTPGVVEKLRQRGMPWTALQKEAVALVVERRRALARYLATPVRDRGGELTGVINLGKTIPKEKLKPLKYVPKRMAAAFEKDVATFYAEARDDAAGATAYEKELRRALRLPDPDHYRDRCFVAEGHPLFLVSGDETPDHVLCPGADDVIPMPPEQTGPDGVKFVPETIVTRLRARAAPVRQRLILGAVAAAVVVVVLLVLEVFADRSPPRIVKVIAENDPTGIEILFDEPIDARSLLPTDTLAEPVRVRDPGGRYIKVEDVARDPENARLVRVTVEPIGEGAYEVVLKGVRDASRKHNAIAPDTTHPFEFSDTLPPELTQVSAHPEDSTKLILLFNEPLEARALRDRNRYTIPGFTVRGAESGKDASQVVLSVDKAFENRGRYSLTVEGIIDRAQNEPPAAITRDFEYVDKIPPTLERAEAAASQVRVLVHFSKRLGAGAANPGLYQVEAAGENEAWSPVEIRLARLPDETRPVVELVTAPLRNGIVYRLTASDVPDRADPPNVLAPTKPVQFRFTGREDKSAPGIGMPRVREGSNNREVQVPFSEEVTADSALRVESYGFVETPVPIEDVTTADGAMVRTVVLRTAMPLPQGSRFTLRAGGLVDLVGNVNDEAVSEPFWVTGMGMAVDATLRMIAAEARPGGTQVVLRFNEALSAPTAQLAANYSVSGNRRVARIEFVPTKPNEVVLILDGSTPLTSGNYAVTARNLMLAELPDFMQQTVSAQVVVP